MASIFPVGATLVDDTEWDEMRPSIMGAPAFHVPFGGHDPVFLCAEAVVLAA